MRKRKRSRSTLVLQSSKGYPANELVPTGLDRPHASAPKADPTLDDVDAPFAGNMERKRRKSFGADPTRLLKRINHCQPVVPARSVATACTLAIGFV
jgi:hypothetical protein